MNLSKVKQINKNWILKEDCEFDSLGMVTSAYENERVLSFLSDKNYLDDIINNDNIVGIICSDNLVRKINLPNDVGILVTDNPKKTFYEIHNFLSDQDFYWNNFKNDISNDACISEEAVIGDNSVIIGNNTIIEPGVVIHPGSIIGNDVIIRSGTKVGTTGFQFINLGEEVLSVKTAGKVIIKDKVEIQHNCCIDRGVFGGDTVLERNVKLDNFIHVAHDNIIGKNTFITAGVKLGGRVVIGENSWIGVNATVSNGIKIGENAKISLGSVVTKDVSDNQIVTGNFAIDHKKFIEHIKNIS